jgi:transposase-like protein
LTRPKNKSFSPEFKEEAVKIVIETSRPVAVVAKELGINESSLETGQPYTAVTMPAKSRRSP